MKCPYCGSKNTQGTNVGARVCARVLSVGAGLIASLGGPSASRVAMESINREVCEYRKYICLDCKHTFEEKRY